MYSCSNIQYRLQINHKHSRRSNLVQLHPSTVNILQCFATWFVGQYTARVVSLSGYSYFRTCVPVLFQQLGGECYYLTSRKP